ncbi:4-coumarate--CoA ligase-like 6 [Bienertia sinuspersici]
MAETISNNHQAQKIPDFHCSWYSPETGIYSSKHPEIQLPKTPFLDVVSHIFSYPNNNSTSALIDSLSGFSIPYSHLFSLVKSISFGLHEMGLSKGGIVTPMNPLSSFSEVTSLGLKRIIKVPKDAVIGEETQTFADFYKLIYSNCGKNVPFPKAKIKQDDTAAIMYSSGTTGASKGVMLSHRNLIAMVELFVRFEASQYKEMNTNENVYLGVLPMFHIYGLALFVFGLVSLNTSVVVMRNYEINEVVKAIAKYKVSHFPVVPPMLAALTAKVRSLGGVDSSGLTGLKQVSSGAASLTTQHIQDFLHVLPTVDFIQVTSI